MCEAVDAQGQPWIENGMVIADPGHGCEFIGLAAKFLLVLQASGKATASQLELLRECRQLFPKVLAQNFRNGYNPHGGICKTYDLLARRPINSDMPWWNLPETIRAAAELAVLCPGHKSPELWEMLAMCSNAFLNNFVNPAMHLMSHQTLDENAKPIDVIPASADADPGYHTGLSIIDFLECLGA